MPTASKYWPEVRNTRKGSIGHTHALARKGIAKVFELLGGERGLWAWAMEDDKNKFAFYTILLPKLIPAEIQDAARQSGDTQIQVLILPPGHSQGETSGVQAPVVLSQDHSLEGHSQAEEAGGTCRQVGEPVREPQA